MESCKLRYFNSLEFFDHTGRVGGCPETPLLRGFQVADSVRHKFHVLAAHKQMILGQGPPIQIHSQ
jgi:hypothetical protein